MSTAGYGEWEQHAQCSVVMWLVQSKIKAGHGKQIAIGSHGNACICMGVCIYIYIYLHNLHV